ncbi:MAG TPA: tRNA (adenosine(37)-N6)-threonylcarbamoyltransferase complex ATPase subunit type 1 TsaE [Chitinophagaceae bacterium]|nr:tRNA (adenosine(37)-N6)-threonylcarbamoyltransferase complex ATPase subunit type 1 TsaE [Chitinophagaceae bacterium]MCB9054599.1 tRNA (adenosine(37)-N6)-threonylcarbamoyltransferase complex ATPase subunit type 1 TsaE [Chitinophagales bacterium]HPG10374.1 tRNA (adenosine(37)-N6)-threonylcarbamoyltransferase complex ATPase subunit type 1 TsaE [Chitinophagaceae bacterium]
MEWEFSLDNIYDVAKAFWEAFPAQKVFAFHGQMGAGKTTFIQALCKAKDVKDVTGSPTFSIINEYEYLCEGTKRAIFHMDLYRLKDKQEAEQAGVEDVLYSGEICLVEWPEKAPAVFPEDTIHIYIDAISSEKRGLKIADI